MTEDLEGLNNNKEYLNNKSIIDQYIEKYVKFAEDFDPIQALNKIYNDPSKFEYIQGLP